MPYQLCGAPPGLRGFLMSRQNQQVEQQQELQAAQQMMGLQGLLMKQQQAAQEQARQQEYRQAIEGLGPNPTQEGLAGIASRFAGPSDLLKTHQSSLDRKAALEAANINKQTQIEANIASAKERLANQLEIARQRGADQRQIAEMNIQGRRELAQLAAGMRQPPAPSLTEIVDPADSSRMIRIDAKSYRGGSVGSPGVIGVSGKEPSAQKRTEQQEGGKKQVSDIIGALNDHYNELQSQGGVISTEQGAASNLVNRAARSGVGQAVLGALGTKEASTQSKIENTRPLLMQAIRQATGMSSKAMDSNIELKFYLQAATDPTRDIESNRAALDVLDRTYGLGMGINAAPTAVKALQDKAPKTDRRQSAPAGGGWSIRPLP
jgi:hypothetical protein